MNIFDELLGEDKRQNNFIREHVVIDFGLPNQYTLEEKQKSVNFFYTAIINIPNVNCIMITNSYSLYTQKISGFEDNFDDVGFLFESKKDAERLFNDIEVDRCIRNILKFNGEIIEAKNIKYEGSDGNISESRKLRSSNGISIESCEESTTNGRPVFEERTIEEEILDIEFYTDILENKIIENNKSWLKFW